MYEYKYPRPMVCVDVALFERRAGEKAGLLLIQRGKEPFAGSWALPGGFVNLDEGLESAARRELQEETNVSVAEMIQVGAFGDPLRDPRGRNISVVFAAVTTESIVPEAGDDAADADVFRLKELPVLAFDHDLIIDSSVKMLKLHGKWQ